MKRCFYTKGNATIEQLVFKYYKKAGNRATNNRFRQQLWADLQCTDLKISKIENIDYTQNNLVNFFIE